MTYGGHTYGGAALGSTSNPTVLAETPTVFQVIRDGEVLEDGVFDVDPLVDTANPFGDFVVIKIDDRAGDKFNKYTRGTRVDVRIALTATSRIERFTGYVVERRELDQQGSDTLEVEAYSFDQFLRRNTATNDQTGNLISEAFQDIIETDTPVSYNAAKVDVGDDQGLTRSYQGEPVENVLRDFAFKSNNEEFGVDDDLDAFFRPRETEHIDRGIDNTQWFNYDIPELGKETINEVEVWFDDGEESVIVDDGTDKLDLQDSLGLPSPGTQRTELNRPLITDIADAEDEGRKYLAFRNATLSGTVTTFGLYDAEPGDTIDVTIDPRGIDTEFVIAGIEYRWGVDETILTIVEKRGDVDDILTELNDSVQRVEMNGANRDAPKNRITTTNARALIDVDVSIGGTTADATKFVNDGRRTVRDGWRGAGLPTIDTIAVGDTNAGLSRSNTTLQNETNSAAATQSLPDAKSVSWDATLTQTGVSEVGLLAADDTLIARATFDDPVDVDGTVTVTLTVSNDTSVSRGVLTDDGQTAVRDVLTDNSPTLPNAYVYGTDGTAVTESDTALYNEVVDVSLEEILIQYADTTAEWQNIVDTGPDTNPLRIINGQLEDTQICFFREGENYDRGQIGFDDGSSDTDISNNDYLSIAGDANVQSTADFGEWDITVNHTIPSSEIEIYVRDSSGGSLGGAPGLQWIWEHANGNTYLLDENTNVGTSLAGFRWSRLSRFTGTNGPLNRPPDLEAGTTHTLRVVVTDSDGSLDGYQYWIDAVAPIDNRYVSNLTFDETTDSNNALSGPEKYPLDVPVSLNTASTRRNVTEANFDLTANDVSNNFYVELANDGSTFTRFNNTQTGSVTFSGPNSGVDTNINLSRWSETTTQTPTNGNDPQAIDVWQLFANPDAVLSDDISKTVTRAVVAPNTITGQIIKEAGLKSDSTLLTRHELAEFEVLAGQRLASSEQTTFTGTD